MVWMSIHGCIQAASTGSRSDSPEQGHSEVVHSGSGRWQHSGDGAVAPMVVAAECIRSTTYSWYRIGVDQQLDAEREGTPLRDHVEPTA